MSGHLSHVKHLHKGTTKNRQYWHLLCCNKWTHWSNPNESGIAVVALGFVFENVTQLPGASVYQRQKEIKTDTLNRKCLYFNTQWKKQKLGRVSKQDRLAKSSLAEAQGFRSHTQNLFVTSYFQHVARGHFRVATLAWTPWWLAEPSDLAPHTLVHTLGIRDKGPLSLLNPALYPPPLPSPFPASLQYPLF